MPRPRLIHPNPWGELPSTAPYVLAKDAAAIKEWNRAAKPDQRIKTELLPDALMGEPLSAPVLLLTSNPSWQDADLTDQDDPTFRAAVLASFDDETTRTLLWVTASFEDTSAGRWWRQRLGALIEATSVEAVATKVAVVQLHNYRSKANSTGLEVPSSRHNYELARKAVGQGAVVVAMTAGGLWQRRVPELARGGAVHMPKNPRSLAITEPNFGDGFARAVEALSG